MTRAADILPRHADQKKIAGSERNYVYWLRESVHQEQVVGDIYLLGSAATPVLAGDCPKRQRR